MVAVNDFNLHVKSGETVVLMGPSGCGKSTTIRTINRLIDPDSGSITFGDIEMTNLSAEELRKIRKRIGFVFQQFNLIGRLTAVENVMLGLVMDGIPKDLAYDKAVEAGEKTEYDLPPDKLKAAQKYAHAGTRKAPTAYKFTKRERKPNATKGGIIAELAEFMEHNSNFDVSNLAITNKERQISFMVGGETFELTLVQKRKPKS